MSLDTRATGKHKPEYITGGIENVSVPVKHIWPDAKLRTFGENSTFWDYQFNGMNIVVGEAWRHEDGWRLRIRIPNSRIYPTTKKDIE